MSIIRRLFNPERYVCCPSPFETGSIPVTVAPTQDVQTIQTPCHIQYAIPDTNVYETMLLTTEPLKAQGQTALQNEVAIVNTQNTDYRQAIRDPLESTINTSATSCPQIEIKITGEASTQWYQLDRPMLNIGRHPSNDIVLDNGAVSNFHAQIIQNGTEFCLVHPHPRRTQTLNGLWFEGDYVRGDETFCRSLLPGDSFSIGDAHCPYVTITYKQNASESEEHEQTIETGIRIDALHLNKTSKDHVVLLDDISLAIPANSFVALVGGSGTGKSTLMDALSGRRPAQSGQILYNGQDYYAQMTAFNKLIGYVPQDDIVHRDLTVERALYYSARLRLAGDLTQEQIAKRIDEVLEDVEMQEHRHQLIQKLSGGQRKRVSIALELLDRPGVFFLDEPTSGLDPGLDYRMMHLLRRLADKGQTIILVTHATNNINICDYVCFLTHGGRLAYFGPVAAALSHFGKQDFAEIYSLLEPSINHPDAPELAAARYKDSPDNQYYVVEQLQRSLKEAEHKGIRTNKIEYPQRSNAWQQFLLLALRYLELLKNDPGNLLILLLQAPIIVLLIVLLIRCEVGTDTFTAKTVTRCPTLATVLTTTGQPNIPGPTDTPITTSCTRVKKFLQHDPRGRVYAHKRGGEKTALQDFITPGSGANAQKLLFIIGFTAVLFGCVNAAREIVKESAIYRRERAVNLGILPYICSKIVVLALLCLIQSAILVITINAIAPFEQGILLAPAVEVYITIALTSLAGLMIGLAISAISPSTDRAMSFIPIILIPQVIFSGTVFPFKDGITQALAMLFVARWSIGALGSSIGLHSDKLGSDRLFANTAIYHGVLFSLYEQVNAVRYLLGMWIALGVIIVTLGGVVVLFMKIKDKERG